MVGEEIALANAIDGLSSVLIMSTVLKVTITIILVFAMIELIKWAFEVRKSYQYRKQVADLFVASTIRQIASEEKLDLDAENKEFKKYMVYFTKLSRKERQRFKEVDDVIEDAMNDKINSKVDKHLEELENKK